MILLASFYNIFYESFSRADARHVCGISLVCPVLTMRTLSAWMAITKPRTLRSVQRLWRHPPSSCPWTRDNFAYTRLPSWTVRHSVPALNFQHMALSELMVAYHPFVKRTENVKLSKELEKFDSVSHDGCVCSWNYSRRIGTTETDRPILER